MTAFPAPAAGGQSYVERSPVPALRELATVVWIQRVGRAAAPYAHRRVPNGAAELVCRVGSAPRVIGPLTSPLVELPTCMSAPASHRTRSCPRRCAVSCRGARPT